jgi:Arc/MetJ-type ribon-helix-helix transcriptional regulator
MVRTQVQLTEKQAEQLKRIAVRERKSVAELVRRAVDQWLVLAEPLSIEERKQRAISIAGKYHSERPDLAINHDKYLNEGSGTW